MRHEIVLQQSSFQGDKNLCAAYLSPKVGTFLASNVHQALQRYLSAELSEYLDGRRPARPKLLPLSSLLYSG